MLRAFDEKGGVGVYTRNIALNLVRRAPEHEFFLYFPNDDNLKTFEEFPNVTARHVRGPGKAVWDQISIPIRFFRDDLDVVFHPKFTVPLLCHGRSAMVLHGAGWFIPETRRYWSRATRLYTRVMMPVYCRSAGAVLSVSEITREVFIDTLGVDPAKITTVYFAPGEQFNTRLTAEQIQAIRSKYALPGEFILTLSGGTKDDRKNFGTILEAFRRIHAVRPCSLVVAGRGCEAFRQRYDIPTDGYGADIHFPGWVDQEDLPAFYQSASLFLYPSNMEAFPIPITEALASGAPIVTSNRFGLEELAADAAVLVDPTSPGDIADAALDVLSNENLSTELRRKAGERAKAFDWETCARKTLELLEAVGRS
jgi:glycosyltransferase involved in cell wall biosynthesis